MQTTEDFLQTVKKPIVVYGIDGGAIATDIYLRKMGLSSECFLSPANPRHDRFCGKPVDTLEYLRQHPECSVITANLDFNTVYNSMRQKGFSNPFYYHASFWPWLDAETPVTDITFLKSFYDPEDRHTMLLLQALYDLRTNNAICRIQSYAAVKDLLYAQDIYWLADRTLRDAELTIIDAGAYNGDTLLSLITAYGKRIKSYHAFEPMPHIYSQLLQTAEQYAADTFIKCHNAALYNQNARMPFHKGVPRSSRLTAKGDLLAICQRLDDLELDIKGRACVKMDIEGGEMSALTGAAQFIKTHRPYLAVCLYHKTNDIYKIPAYLQALVPHYKFTLAGGVHTVCYATPD